MVDDTQQMPLRIAHQYGMNLVLVHDPLDFRYLSCRQNHLRFSRHDVAHGMVEELRLPSLHRTADVAVGYQPDDFSVRERNAQSQLSFTDMDDCLAQMHLLRNDGQIVRTHHILRSCQQTFAQLTTWMELCEVLWFKVPDTHQCDRQRIANTRYTHNSPVNNPPPTKCVVKLVSRPSISGDGKYHEMKNNTQAQYNNQRYFFSSVKP